MFYATILIVTDKLTSVLAHPSYPTLDACLAKVDTILESFMKRFPDVFTVGAACIPENIVNIIHPSI